MSNDDHIIVIASIDEEENGILHNKLDQPIELSTRENWEVGLLRFCYPKTWVALEEVSSFDISFAVEIIDRTIYQVETYVLTAKIIIKHGFNLDLVSDPIETLNSAVRLQINKVITKFLSRRDEQYFANIPDLSVDNYWSLAYDEENILKIRDPMFFHRLEYYRTRIHNIRGLRLWRLLGFTQIREGSQKYKLPLFATRTPSIPNTISNIHIYAPNLIKPQRVADTFKPLLEIVPVKFFEYDSGAGEQRESEIVTLCQAHPIYKKVFGGYINDVTLVMKDNNDLDVTGITGNFSAVLHFRKCRTSISKINFERVS